MTTADLISPAYLETQVALHATPRGYGAKGARWAPTVLGLADALACHSVLDYGCGQGSLAEMLRASVRLIVNQYDPAIPRHAQLPSPADLVVCTDVLEHVESEKIFAVVSHLRDLTRVALFVVVSLVETSKRLIDGRNAHVLIRSVDWWRYQFAEQGLTVVRELAIRPEKQWVAVLCP